MNMRYHYNTTLKYQRGVVLFIAMIALVVMSLAAVALIRSVDTNTLITGNLSYKQTSIASASYGIESLTQYLATIDFADGNTSRPNFGYYATCITTSNTPGQCDGARITEPATWEAGARSGLAIHLGLNNGVDAYGNRVEYIVERMCTLPVNFSTIPADPQIASSCLVALDSEDNNTRRFYPNAPLSFPSGLPVYRVTVRISGPKNTVSFIQSFIS